MSKIETKIHKSANVSGHTAFEISYMKDNPYNCHALTEDRNRHGVCKWYYPDGSISVVETYYKGKLHGECYYPYRPDGENYAWYLWGDKVSEEEYCKYKLIEKLSGLDNGD